MDTFDRHGLDQFKNMTPEEQQALLERYQREEEESGGCSGNCAGCSADCGSREGDPNLTPRMAKKIYAVFSGKGGTGKSTVTALLACALARRGLKVGILDADLTGPGIPHLFGSDKLAESDNERVYTVKLEGGVEYISMAAVQDSAEKPLLWYGKDLAVGALYFYSEVKWEDIDVMLVDMPTGIGDIPLQIYTIIPFDGSILVAEPTKLCDFVSKKSAVLSEMVYIHILGVVENKVTDPEDAAAHAEALELPLVAALPYDPMLALDGDFGKIAEHECPELDKLADSIAEQARA